MREAYGIILAGGQARRLGHATSQARILKKLSLQHNLRSGTNMKALQKC